MDNINNLKLLIEENEDLIDFGSNENAVEQVWIKNAQLKLGVEFTHSYIWFLKNYARGSICNEEIFSIYGIDFDKVVGGDIVYQNLMNRKDGTAEPNEIYVCENDYGERFFFNYTFLKDGECPVYIKLPSGKQILYAHDFYDFLDKRIKVFL
jgi:hypothetical protein